MRTMAEKPTVPEVLPLVRELYASPEGAVGCCLHVVLDDGNVRDDDVQYCVDRATERAHPKCETLARLLLRMSKTQRQKLSASAYK